MVEITERIKMTQIKINKRELDYLNDLVTNELQSLKWQEMNENSVLDEMEIWNLSNKLGDEDLSEDEELELFCDRVGIDLEEH